MLPKEFLSAVVAFHVLVLDRFRSVASILHPLAMILCEVEIAFRIRQDLPSRSRCVNNQLPRNIERPSRGR